MHHFLDHLGLDGAVAEVLAVEVLGLVSHAVAAVPDDRDLDFCVVRQLSQLAGLVRCNCTLEASAHRFKLFIALDVSDIKTGSQRVHVKKGVFAVLNISDRLSIQGLMALVAYSRQVHPCAFLFDFNALESTRLNKVTLHRGNHPRRTNPSLLRD